MSPDVAKSTLIEQHVHLEAGSGQVIGARLPAQVPSHRLVLFSAQSSSSCLNSCFIIQAGH